jgi:hypothetical protein
MLHCSIREGGKPNSIDEERPTSQISFPSSNKDINTINEMAASFGMSSAPKGAKRGKATKIDDSLAMLPPDFEPGEDDVICQRGKLDFFVVHHIVDVAISKTPVILTRFFCVCCYYSRQRQLRACRQQALQATDR